MMYKFDRKDNGKKYKNVIYKIENILLKKIYIGKTVYLPDRISLHKSRYRNESYTSDLYKDMRKFGLSNFILTIIEECNSTNINERESYWIKEYQATINGYNRSESQGGLSSSLYTDEIRKKLSESSSKEKNQFYNKTHTKEVRNRINLDRKASEETKEKMRVNSKACENSKGKKCLLIIEDKKLEFETLSKCYRYLKNNNLFPDYSFNTFARWFRNNKLESKNLLYTIVEYDNEKETIKYEK